MQLILWWAKAIQWKFSILLSPSLSILDCCCDFISSNNLLLIAWVSLWDRPPTLFSNLWIESPLVLLSYRLHQGGIDSLISILSFFICSISGPTNLLYKFLPPCYSPPSWIPTCNHAMSNLNGTRFQLILHFQHNQAMVWLQALEAYKQGLTWIYLPSVN